MASQLTKDRQPARYRGLLALALVLVAPCSPAAVVVGGAEYFNWQEFDESGEQLLEESGPRFFVGVEEENRLEGVWRSRFATRIYSGQVGYDGQYQDGTPVTSDTDYTGIAVDLDFIHELSDSVPLHRDHWGVLFGLVYDYWRRNILGPGGYEETYQVASARLGAVYADDRWYARSGVKIPFWIREEVKLTRLGFASDPVLEPGGDFSLFASVSYRFRKYWEAGLYADSYRFKQSGDEQVEDPVSGDIFNVHQPRSEQYTLGLFATYNF